MQSKVLISVVGALLALMGCSTEKVYVGDDTPVRTGASLSDYEGSWEGYVEAHEWSDSSDSIRVMLDAEGNGVLEVGEPASGPAPEVDPQSAPPYGDEEFTEALHVREELFPGFSFPIVNARVEAKRIRISTVLAEPYREWCELQTPHLDEVNTDTESYWCLPNVGFGSNGDECFLGSDVDQTEPIDCGQLACMTACRCDADGCSVANGQPQMIFDAELEADGEELEGSLKHNGNIFTVRMTLAE